MGKVLSLFAAVAIMVAAALLPARNHVHAQTVSQLGCSGTSTPSPMQGHYTGPWHSDGDYHFQAFNTDIDLTITIDGTIDATVGPTGQLSGEVTGNVNAPITHNGAQDVSSGIGSISGTLSGSVSGATATLVLSQPVIDMHWGTFGGHAAERFITMPDYQFSAGSADCTRAQGTIAEQGFPEQIIVADGTAQDPVWAPGIGSATGTWQLTSDNASLFAQLSQQVDSFINGANSTLAELGVHPTPGSIEQRIVQPLQHLQSTIEASPDVSRCLLERLHAWEASILPNLFQGAKAGASASDVLALRTAEDLLRAARTLNSDCSLPDGGAPAALLDADHARLDQSIAARDWSQTALWARESILLQGDGSQSGLQGEIDADMHALLQGTSGSAALLQFARAAYAFGDSGDASAAYHQLVAHLRFLAETPPFVKPAGSHNTKKHRKTPKKRRKPHALPAASPTPSPTLTPLPAVPTLDQTLNGSIAHLTIAPPTGTPPTFSWQPISGAVQYVITVAGENGQPLLWSWSGAGTSVTYGETTIAGLAGSEADGWPASLSAGYTWSVIALDATGQIIGIALRPVS